MDKGSFVSIDLTKTESKDQIYVQKDTVGNSNQNNWCTYFRNGMFRAIRSVGKIPTDLMDAWRNSTTPQKVMHTVIAVYCTAATVYIIYLESQNRQTPVDNLNESNNTFLLLNQPSFLSDQPSLEEIQALPRNYSYFLNLEAEKCHKQFYESGAEKTSLSGTISMQVCYTLIDKICKTGTDMMEIMFKLKKIPKSLQQKISSVGEVIEDLEYIQKEFSCKKVGFYHLL